MTKKQRIIPRQALREAGLDGDGSFSNLYRQLRIDALRMGGLTLQAITHALIREGFPPIQGGGVHE
jgi:hypothetical protein